VPHGPRVDGAAARPKRALRHVQRHIHVSAFVHKHCRVEPVVAAHRDASVTGNLLQLRQRRFTLGPAVGLEQLRVPDQTVAILHEKIAAVAQVGLLAFALVRQQRIPIGLRLLGLVRVPLAVKIHCRIPGDYPTAEYPTCLSVKTLQPWPIAQ